MTYVEHSAFTLAKLNTHSPVHMPLYDGTEGIQRLANVRKPAALARPVRRICRAIAASIAAHRACRSPVQAQHGRRAARWPRALRKCDAIRRSHGVVDWAIRPTPCCPAMIDTLSISSVKSSGTPLIATGSPRSKSISTSAACLRCCVGRLRPRVRWFRRIAGHIVVDRASPQVRMGAERRAGLAVKGDDAQLGIQRAHTVFDSHSIETVAVMRHRRGVFDQRHFDELPADDRLRERKGHRLGAVRQHAVLQDGQDEFVRKLVPHIEDVRPDCARSAARDRGPPRAHGPGPRRASASRSQRHARRRAQESLRRRSQIRSRQRRCALSCSRKSFEPLDQAPARGGRRARPPEWCRRRR